MYFNCTLWPILPVLCAISPPQGTLSGEPGTSGCSPAGQFGAVAENKDDIYIGIGILALRGFFVCDPLQNT